MKDELEKLYELKGPNEPDYHLSWKEKIIGISVCIIILIFSVSIVVISLESIYDWFSGEHLIPSIEKHILEFYYLIKRIP